MIETLLLQWKILIGFTSDYFIFHQLNTAAVNGFIIGLTFSPLTLFRSWTIIRITMWSRHIANKQFKVLDNSFTKTMIRSSAIGFVIIAGFIVFIALTKWLDIKLAERALSLALICILSIPVLLYNIVNDWATYLRCRKKESFLLNSIFSGFLCAISTLLLGYSFGVSGIVYGYGFITLLLSLPWAYHTLNTKKSE